MTKEEKKIATIAGVGLAIILSLCLWVELSPMGRGVWNLWAGLVQKVDDSTSYQTRKKTEDTCRAMVSSYEADRLVWVQYKDSDNEEKQSWAEQAKMRANKTAATYNNYILENYFVLAGNVPEDIKTELPYLE